MTGIVREHNLLTGFRFVIGEYLLVAIGLAALGAYYAAVADWIDAAIWFGIVLNCLAIAVLAIGSLRARESDFGSLPMLRSTFRQTVGHRHPRLWRRTTALITVTFIPFLLAAWLLVERFRRSGRTSARRSTAESG